MESFDEKRNTLETLKHGLESARHSSDPETIKELREEIEKLEAELATLPKDLSQEPEENNLLNPTDNTSKDTPEGPYSERKTYPKVDTHKDAMDEIHSILSKDK